jgi:type II secretory pathway predicted ATPase ExeA
MFSEFFKLKMNPFGETPDTRFFFNSASHLAALDSVMSAIHEGKGFAMVTGDVGVGKTMLSRMFMMHLQNVMPTALILNPIVSQQDLLSSVREELKLRAPSKITVKSEYDVLAKFLMETAQKKKRTVLFIDEAQRLSFEAFEALRLLSNLEAPDHKLLQIVLIGQAELKSRLNDFDLRQFRQRISVETEILPMPPAAIGGYIKHRLEVAGGTNFVRFEDDAVNLISKACKNIPRLINSLCEKVIAAAEKEEVRLIGPAFVQALLPPEPHSGWKKLFKGLGREVSP